MNDQTQPKFEFEIEKGKPIPKLGPPFGRGMNKYPFPLMEIGDSFSVPKNQGNFLNIRNSALSWGKRNGKSFTTRVIGDLLHVWRTK